jgi:hypothetical protein
MIAAAGGDLRRSNRRGRCHIAGAACVGREIGRAGSGQIALMCYG